MLEPSLRQDLAVSGFALVGKLVTDSDLALLREEVDQLLDASADRGGVRNALGKSPRLRDLAASGPPAGLALALLGPSARPTKLTVFDKTAGANWKVPWHQDVTIAVSERRKIEGFARWSIKDGVPHVQPPTAVLESLLAIRLHLDDTAATNGALRVLAGTHRFGRLSTAEVAAFRRELPETVCAVPAGGAMLMRPLLLHASSPSVEPARRRVLHFEYSAAELPGGLAWA